MAGRAGLPGQLRPFVPQRGPVVVWRGPQHPAAALAVPPGRGAVRGRDRPGGGVGPVDRGGPPGRRRVGAVARAGPAPAAAAGDLDPGGLGGPDRRRRRPGPRHAAGERTPQPAPGADGAAERSGDGRPAGRSEHGKGAQLMVDEMDLLSGLKTAEPVRPRAFEAARATLRAAMVMEDGVPEPATGAVRRARWGRGRVAGLSVVAVGAAAAAVVLVVASTSSAPGPHGTASGTTPAPAKAAPAAVNPELAQLAATITVPQVSLPGNATMEIRNQSPTSATPGANGIDLYLNDGTYYWGINKTDLLRSIASGQDSGQGAFKRSIAAALLAAKGDVATGRAQMSVANYLGGKPPSATVNAQARQAEIEKLKAVDKEKHIKYTPPKPLTPQQKAEQTDNLIWMNSNYALTAAPENPNVRAGVLRILATMPNVKVTHTTTAGQATLTMSDSWPKLSGDDTESTVISASTGLPIATSDRGTGDPSSTFYYHPTRVSLAQVKAGRF